jgi:hypothetical protein
MSKVYSDIYIYIYICWGSDVLLVVLNCHVGSSVVLGLFMLCELLSGLLVWIIVLGAGRQVVVEQSMVSGRGASLPFCVGEAHCQRDNETKGVPMNENPQ